MVPFKIFDEKNKKTWIVLNYHPKVDAYLAARQDESDQDGEFRLVPTKEILTFRMLELCEAGEE